MKWVKRIDGVYIKFQDISKNAYLGAKIEFKEYVYLATVYVTNGNQSQVIKIDENSYSSLSQAKQFCDRVIKRIIDNVWEMYEG